MNAITALCRRSAAAVFNCHSHPSVEGEESLCRH